MSPFTSSSQESDGSLSKTPTKGLLPTCFINLPCADIDALREECPELYRQWLDMKILGATALVWPEGSIDASASDAVHEDQSDMAVEVESFGYTNDANDANDAAQGKQDRHDDVVDSTYWVLKAGGPELPAEVPAVMVVDEGEAEDFSSPETQHTKHEA